MIEKLQLKEFKHLPGKNCVTTAIRNILNFYRFRYQEALIFGLAEGLGFGFRQNHELENPYLSGVGRQLVNSFCANLELDYEVREFEDEDDAMADLIEHLERQIPLIIQVDLFHLPYFDSASHFSAHRVVVAGMDHDNVLLADTGFHHLQVCPVAAFVRARQSSQPPFLHKNRRMRIGKPKQRPFVEEMITKALYNLCEKFARQNSGFNLEEVFLLRDNLDRYRSPQALYVQIEKAGTGGGLGRKLFSQFLDLAYQLYSRGIYERAATGFEESALIWRQIALKAKRGQLKNTDKQLKRVYQLETESLSFIRRFEADEL